MITDEVDPVIAVDKMRKQVREAKLIGVQNQIIWTFSKFLYRFNHIALLIFVYFFVC